MIIRAREGRGLTQSQMAQRLGASLKQTYSLRQYQKIEEGRFPKYKKEIVQQIDRLLGTNAYDVIYEQNVPRETAPPQRQPEREVSSSSELMEIMRERVKELKEDKEWLKKNLEFSLTGLAIGQKSILAHVATVLEKDDEREAAGNKKKEQTLKEDTDRRIGDKMSGLLQKDNSLGR